MQDAWLRFASAKGGIMMNLTPEIVYKAIAAKPFGKEQTAKTWKDVDPSLPAEPILVYGPPSTSGTRDALAELILTKGYGCKVEILPGTVLPLVNGLARGDVDVLMEVWTANPAG